MPAFVVAAVLTTVPDYRAITRVDSGFVANVTTVGPELLRPLWRVALGAATLAYHRPAAATE